MSIETQLYAVLIADSAVRGYVSSGSPLVHRIYPLRAPDNAAVPYITYQVIVGTAYNYLEGAPDTERKLIQYNCVSNSYGQAKGMAEAIKSALETNYGWLGGESDDYFPSTQNYRVRLDWSYSD